MFFPLQTLPKIALGNHFSFISHHHAWQTQADDVQQGKLSGWVLIPVQQMKS